MNIRTLINTTAVCGLLGPGVFIAKAAIPPAPAWASHYQRVWAQDFTTMTDLKQLRVSDNSMDNGTWIAHKPGGGDWFTFANPTANYHPFGVGGGFLTIRVQKDGHDPNHWFAGYSGGLLSSLDGAGKGFAQQYGYFECSMWTPGGPNTWPAFWLLDAPSVTDRNLNAAEIDITESYGNFGTGPGQKPPGDPDENTMTWHRWGNNGKPSSANGTFVKEPGMTAGFHTYGADVEPTGITWYFDRKKVWWAPIFPEAERPLYVLLNLALGGGTHNNAKGDNYDWNLTPNPSDLKVKYVAVWASPASPNYTGPPVAPENLAAVRGNRLVSLSWSPAPGAVSYKVIRNGSPIAAGLTATAYVDRNLANGTRYTYRLVTVNAKGSSPTSEAVSATPESGPPIVPTGLHATAGDHQVTLSWTASPDAASYDIFQGNESGVKGARMVESKVVTPHVTETGLIDGIPYFYTVTAISPGGASGHSNEANAIPASDAETIAIAFAGRPPAVEANADPIWNSVPAYPINRLGLGAPTTTNGAFQMLWDRTNLYTRFTVDDSSLVMGTPDYNGDAVELYLDGKNSKQTRYDDTDYRYTFGWGHNSFSEPVPSAMTGIKFSRHPYSGGYWETIVIPWATLRVVPFPGMSLGLDAAIDDAANAKQGRTSALFWHDNTANDYQNPSLFGDGTLQPAAPPPPLPDGIYSVINVKSGKALEAPGASLANVPLDQLKYDGGANQQWILTNLGGGSYAVQNVKSRSVVDCSPTFDNGHPVVQWPINGTPSATQRFTITAVAGHFLLTNVYSGKALDVAASSTADHAGIIQSACTAAGSQLWDLVRKR